MKKILIFTVLTLSSFDFSKCYDEQENSNSSESTHTKSIGAILDSNLNNPADEIYQELSPKIAVGLFVAFGVFWILSQTLQGFEYRG